jgi:hypothetical protein
MATISLKAERDVAAPAARTLAAVRTPAAFRGWVPGVTGVEDLDGAGHFTCLFHFAVFNLKFKVTMTNVDASTTRFSTSAVIIGKVEALVTVTDAGKGANKGASKVTVELEGLLRSPVMHRMAVSLFQKGADVVSQRLSAHLAMEQAA